MVARVEDDVVGQGGERPGEGLVHLLRVAAREVDAAAAVDEQGVAGDEAVADEKALAAGRVTRGVDECDLDVTDGRAIAAVAADEVGLADAGDLLESVGLERVDVDRASARVEQLGDAAGDRNPNMPPPQWSGW